MNSFISWIGGKKLLRKELEKLFPDRIDKYIEVFGGAAWLLFLSEKHAETEVYNDYNSELVNLFRCVKYHVPELKRELNYSLNSREMFRDMKDSYSVAGLTDIQRAAKFFMLIKTSYGSNQKNFGCVKKNIEAMIAYLDGIHKRLSKVIIENKDFADLIKVYDRPNTLFYCDPPYFNSEKYYQVKFTESDHLRLIEVLKNIKGKFLLSYNDCDQIRSYYKDFNIIATSRNHNLVARITDKPHEFKELIIKNY